MVKMKLLDTVFLLENREQMVKSYVKTNIFDEEDVRIIDSITHGDPFTKLVADCYYYFGNRYNKDVKPRRLDEREINLLKDFHENLKSYNKNIFPLTDLYANKDKFSHPLDSLNCLRWREYIINKIKSIPSIYLRNLRQDIRKERNQYEFKDLLEDINSILRYMELLNRLSDDKKQKILKKVFSSNFTTFQQIRDRFTQITIPYLNENNPLEVLIEKIYDMGDEAEMIYDKDNILAVVIKSFEAMSYIGCSAQWCFVTQEYQWEGYAPEGYCMIVFNLNEEPSSPIRMVVVLDDGNVYDMYNDLIDDDGEYLKSLGIEDLIYRYQPDKLNLSEIFLSIINEKY